MKKILIVHNRYRITGGEDVAVNNEVEILRKNYEVETLFFSNEDINSKFKQIFYFFINKNLESNKIFENKLKSFKPDLVYIHNTWFKVSLGIFKILKKSNTRYVIKIHNYRYDCGRFLLKKYHLNNEDFCNACGYHKSLNFLFNKYYKNSYMKSIFLIIYNKKYYKILKNSELLTLTKFHKKTLINKGFDPKKIRILYNPINILENQEKVELFNLEPKSYIIYAGLISEEKGVKQLIETYKQIDMFKKKLVIVGEGPLLNKLKNENVVDKILFLGNLSNIKVINLIKNSYSVVTNTKLLEGQPTLLSEASMLGINSIYPKNGGIQEFFPSQNPFSFEPHSKQDLLAKLILLKNENLVLNQGIKNFNYTKKILNTKNYISCIDGLMD